ncbi:minor capsid protein [Clostridium intestinale]|uniref:Phage putative head morphogenesis protein, SPP1 gp7 family n=1 Tax=Clostridium intestinale DSM 6191 TaxID=1121320 RepID=A0A1M6AJ62_9CLOT|nr:minor capsid protein [Clostridium intestinale]SHI36243.1 phage putative head morphogenesis protein, SPP1 gp7 family [Clostridium intestinale DSM 6191]
MKSNTYWENRANERMAEYHKSSDETIYKINLAYDKAIKDINKDIEKIFNKFVLDGGLTQSEAMELLNTSVSQKELDSIRVKIKGIQDEDLKKYLMSQLNAKAYKARITRLEAIKESIYINTKLAADVEINTSTQLYTDTSSKSYHRNIFDIQKGIGVGFNVAQMPVQTIQEILKNKWSGKHYSRRIWHNTDVLVEKLEEVITSGLMAGKSSRRMADELRELTDYGKFAAERLIRTETTYIVNAAELESYKELGIERYIYVATLDLRTSDVCREMDGKIIKVDKAKVGVNLPPLHPYCRSTTRAYFENIERLKRRARDPVTGKTYIIPGNMNYKEWYDKFVVKKYGKEQTKMLEKKVHDK